jgi:hypothetical protein
LNIWSSNIRFLHRNFDYNSVFKHKKPPWGGFSSHSSVVYSSVFSCIPLPAYIVSFHGLHIKPSRGGADRTEHEEFNVVVDAATGVALLGMSYR